MADPTVIQQTQTSIPDYARSYVETMLGRAQAATLDQPYQRYTGQRFAAVDPLTGSAYSTLQNMGLDPRSAYTLQNVYNMAAQAGTSSYDPTAYRNPYVSQAAYNPTNFSYTRVGAPDVTQYRMQQPQNVAGASAKAAQLGVSPTATAQAMRAAQMGAAPTVSGQTGLASLLAASPQMQAAQANLTQLNAAPTYTGQQLNYSPQSLGYQAVGAERVNALPLRDLQMQAAGNVGTGSFTQPGAAQAYMSPYMQNVVDIQQREAQRQADIAATKRGAGFAQAGAFGGSRQAIENAEAARNLATQKGDIQAQGLQSAFQAGQGQFNTEQQAALQAALANQQVQQQTGVQNLSALLQTQGLGAQTGLQAQQLNQQTGLQALLANQQAGMQTGQFNAQQAYNTALQNAQLAQQQQLANQGLQGQYGLQQGQMNQATALQNAQLAQQAAANNQQYGAQYGLQQGQMNQQMAMANLANLQQAALANQQYGAQYGLQQGQFNQAANAANQQAANQVALANQALSGQYGLTQGQFGQAAALQNAQMQQQANLANQQAGLTTGQQNLAANLAVQQLSNQQELQAALANQQAGMTTQQQQELARQYGYGQQMVNAANTAQYGQASNQLQEQANQFGAGYGLQALQTGIQGMQNYGNLSGLYNQQAMNIANAQNAIGQQQQNYQNTQLAQNYNDFVNQRNYPLEQIGQFSNILRGLPLNQSTTAQYQQAPSLASQLAGFGTAAYGASQLGNLFKAKGGMIRQPRGLPALAIAQMG